MTTQDPERLAEKLEERVPATEAEAAAMAAKIEEHLRKTEAAAKAAKIEDRMTITEAAAYVRSTLKPSSECRPTHQEILTTAKNRWHVSGLDYSPQQYAEWLAKECRVLQADQSWFKPEPEVDEAALCEQEIWNITDKSNVREQAYAIITKYLAKRPRVEVPKDVMRAADTMTGADSASHVGVMRRWIKSLSQEPRS